MGAKRIVTTEAYFTTDELARRCVEFLDGKTPLTRFRRIFEPSAGAGAFVRALAGRQVDAIDVKPRDSTVALGDFFQFPFSPEPDLLIVGNPPYGQRGTLAMRFLTRSMQFGSVVAFILPRSFKKHTFLNRVDRNFHLLGSFDCEDFELPDGTPVTVRSVFQVWERQPVLRPLVELPSEHDDFEMKHFHLSRTSPERLQEARERYEFAIPQVGSNFRPRAIGELRTGSHWFIRPKAPGVRQRFEKLDFGFLDGLNTAHKSLSRKDIVTAYARNNPE